MIDLYTWNTPNGWKASILLEELGCGYSVHPINLGEGQQHSAEFSALSPQNRIPVIVDHDVEGDPIRVFESGAIAIYLAEKHASNLLPSAPRSRTEVLAWCTFQLAHVGPMLGQLGRTTVFAHEKSASEIEYFKHEVLRLLDALDHQLAGKEYLVGDYSLADILNYPWIAGGIGMLRDDVPELCENRAHLHDWIARVGQRPAVQKGMRIPG